MKMHKLYIISFIVALLFLLVACSENKESSANPLIGKWVIVADEKGEPPPDGVNVYWEFRDDELIMEFVDRGGKEDSEHENFSISNYEIGSDEVKVGVIGEDDEARILTVALTGNNKIKILSPEDESFLIADRYDPTGSSGREQGRAGIAALEGRTFGGDECLMELEFASDERVYVTHGFTGQTTIGTYEEDHNRIIVYTKEQDMVFKRYGNMLDGGELIGKCILIK